MRAFKNGISILICLATSVQAFCLSSAKAKLLQISSNRHYIYQLPNKQQRQAQLGVRRFLSERHDTLLASRRNLLNLGTALVTLPIIGEDLSRVASFSIRPNGDEAFMMNAPSQGWDCVKEVTLVFHGAGGKDKNTDALLKELQQLDCETSYSTVLDWNEYSKNILQASFNGQVIGRLVADQLLSKAPLLQKVHLIGISVGAFGCTTCAETIKSSRPRIYVQQTLLDPFCQRGVFDIWYGSRRFGASADYAQQFINTDDPVFSTNSPLKKCAIYDVTSLRPREVFGHDWPLIYYTQQGKVGFVDANDKGERGSVTVVGR